MSKQYLSTPLRRSVRCFMVTGLTTAAFVSASMSVSADLDVCDTVFAVHDQDLNDSQIVTIDTAVTALPAGFHPGFDIEGLDVSPLGDIYASSGDDTEKPGYLYKLNSDGSIEESIKICFEFPGGTGSEPQVIVHGKEISSLSFKPDGTLWGWAEECGLIQIGTGPLGPDDPPILPPPLDSCDGTANARLVLAFPQDNGDTCLTKKPPKVTPIVEDMTWDNDGKKLYYAYKSEVWVYDAIGNSTTLLYDKLKRNIEAIEMFPEIDDKLLLNQHGSRHLTVLSDIFIPSLIHHYPSPVTVGEFKDIEAIGTCSDDPFDQLFCILEETGWIYTKDSFDDSSSPVKVGNTEFEIYGMAVRVDQETVTVAINSRLPVGGMSYHEVQIAWGDIIFDFEPYNSEKETKYGVHFDAAGDSGVVDGVGLYEVSELKSVSKANRGHRNFSTYERYITRRHGHPSLGDLPIIGNDYFGDKDKMPTSIATGTMVQGLGDGFVTLDSAQLALMGLDFVTGLLGKVPANLDVQDDITPVDPYNGPYRDDEPRPLPEPPLGPKPENELGQYTFGFQFKRQADMTGEFLIHLFIECGNDGVVLKGILPDC